MEKNLCQMAEAATSINDNLRLESTAASKQVRPAFAWIFPRKVSIRLSCLLNLLSAELMLLFQCHEVCLGMNTSV